MKTKSGYNVVDPTSSMRVKVCLSDRGRCVHVLLGNDVGAGLLMTYFPHLVVDIDVPRYAG